MTSAITAIIFLVFFVFTISVPIIGIIAVIKYILSCGKSENSNNNTQTKHTSNLYQEIQVPDMSQTPLVQNMSQSSTIQNISQVHSVPISSEESKVTRFDRINKIKGEIGELEIEGEIIKNFKDINHVFKHIKVPKSNGKITEIDLLLLSKKGVIVIESKNFSGSIYGSENDYKWTQFFNKNSKFFFYNPIKQNQNHIDALKEFLRTPTNLNIYKSVIVFGNNAKLQKINYAKSNNLIVCNTINLAETINSIQESSTEIFDDDQIKYIYIKLKEFENTVSNLTEFTELV